MTDDDLERLLTPIDADNPSGENLEYSAAFLDLEREAAGKEERYSGGELIPAEDPDWKVVLRLSEELLGGTKDLRVGVQLARAETAMHGLEGLVGGLALVRGMLERFWDDVHPRLDAAEAFDPFDRINAIANLSGDQGLTKLLRQTYVVEARSVGRFTFRDLDLAEERIAAREGETPPSLNLLKAALREAGGDYASSRHTLLTTAREHLRSIEQIFRDRTSGDSPDLNGLCKQIDFGIAYLAAGLVGKGDQAQFIAPGGAAGSQSNSGATDGVAAADRGGGVGPLQTRADAKRALEEVCLFLERSEPSNPAPLLIRRAQRLIDRGFMDIIQDLAPEALAQIESLAGNRPAESSAEQE